MDGAFTQPLTADRLARAALAGSGGTTAQGDFTRDGVARMMADGAWNASVCGEHARTPSPPAVAAAADAGGGSGNPEGIGGDASTLFDAVPGSFIAHLCPRFGNGSTGAQAAFRGIASDMDCEEMHVLSTRGVVAHESSGVQSYHVPGSVHVMFVGDLSNRGTLADSYDLAPDVSCAELVYTLYSDAGTSFVNNLAGFFAFCLVDAETSAVFAAVDRHGRACSKGFYRLFASKTTHRLVYFGFWWSDDSRNEMHFLGLVHFWLLPFLANLSPHLSSSPSHLTEGPRVDFVRLRGESVGQDQRELSWSGCAGTRGVKLN
jgi:hypothetical protein